MGALSREVLAAVAPLEDGYADVLASVVHLIDDDPRVRALWLGGSVGGASPTPGATSTSWSPSPTASPSGTRRTGTCSTR
jgi:hypothetical protein